MKLSIAEFVGICVITLLISLAVYDGFNDYQANETWEVYVQTHHCNKFDPAAKDTQPAQQTSEALTVINAYHSRSAWLCDNNVLLLR